jgi:hypothetical protein
MAAIHAMNDLRGGENQIKARVLGGGEEQPGMKGISSVRSLQRRQKGREDTDIADLSLDHDIDKLRRQMGRLKMGIKTGAVRVEAQVMPTELLVSSL